MPRRLLVAVVLVGLGLLGLWIARDDGERAREHDLTRLARDGDTPSMELAPPEASAEPLAAPRPEVDGVAAPAPAAAETSAPAAETRPLLVYTWSLDSEPLTDVSVAIHPHGSLQTVHVTTADVDGDAVAVARVPVTGTLRLEAERDGWFQVAQNFGAAFAPTGPLGRADADTHEVHLGLDRAVTVHVDVVAERDGMPVHRADVDLRVFGRPYTAFGGVFTEMFGGDDHVSLGRSTDGAGRVSFTLPGRGWTHAEVDVAADAFEPVAARRVELALAEAGVHVERVALSGDPGLVHVSALALAESGPVAGLQMIAGRVEPTSRADVVQVAQLWRGPTDTQGRFGFHVVPGGAGERLVLRTAGAPWGSVGWVGPLGWDELTSGTQVVRLGVPVLELPVRLHGTVPGGRYFVEWAPVVDGVALAGAGSQGVANDGGDPLEGLVEVPAVGPVRLSARHMFGAGDPALGVVVDPASPPALVELDAPRLHLVDGVVALPADLPAEGDVTVEFARRRGQVLAQAVVGRDGRFAAGGLAPGAYDVEVWHWRPGHNRIVVGYWELQVEADLSGLVFDPRDRAGERRPR